TQLTIRTAVPSTRAAANGVPATDAVAIGATAMIMGMPVTAIANPVPLSSAAGANMATPARSAPASAAQARTRHAACALRRPWRARRTRANDAATARIAAV